MLFWTGTNTGMPTKAIFLFDKSIHFILFRNQIGVTHKETNIAVGFFFRLLRIGGIRKVQFVDFN